MHAEKDGGLIKFQPRKYLLVPVLPVSGLHTLHPLYFCGIKKGTSYIQRHSGRSPRHQETISSLSKVSSPPNTNKNDKLEYSSRG